MTHRSVVRSGGARRTARVRETAGVAAGFLSLLVKLTSASERLQQARPRRR